MFVYRLYGLQVGASHALTGLREESDGEIDIFINFVGDDPLERPVSSGYYRFSNLPDGSLLYGMGSEQSYAEFVIANSGTSIRVAQTQDVPFPEVTRFLFSVAFGVAFRFRGVLSLHASAVSVGTGAVLFAGPSGTGKSTLGAAFHKRGCSLITDDLAPLDDSGDKIYLFPGYAGIRLREDSINHLYDADMVSQAVKLRAKYQYYLQEPSATKVPLEAIYILAPRNASLHGPRIVPVHGKDVLITLTNHLYLNEFVGRRWIERDFPRVRNLMHQVPVYLLERTTSLSDLDATIDLVLAQHGLTG